MNRLQLLIGLIIVAGCDSLQIPQIVNDLPRSEFSFGFNGRLEKLEDAFYAAHFKYKELDYNSHWQKDAEYEFKIVRSDTIVTYIVTLQDCQSIYYLVKWNDTWKCDSSYLHVNSYSSNLDSISKDAARSILKEEIIAPLQQRFKETTNTYHWTIEKTTDTTYVKVLDQHNSLRKLYVYSLDTIGNSIAEKDIFNYLGDSTIHYRKSQHQRFMYLESKQVIRNNK